MPRRVDPTKCPYPGLEHLTVSAELSGKILSNRPVKELPGFVEGAVIYATDFSWEQPDSETFPKGMTGVTFVKCNLSNVIVPEGNTIIDCIQTRFKVQNDRNDWIIDKDNLPVKPLNYRVFEKFGLPVPTPDKLPLEEAVEAVDLVKQATIEKAALDAAAEGEKA